MTIDKLPESLIVSDPLYKKGFADGAASRDAEIELLEKALTASWPSGAEGAAFKYWNEARKLRNAE